MVQSVSTILSRDLVGIKKQPSHDEVTQRSTADQQEYDPYDHGNIDKPLSRSGALLHLIKYIVGTGILAIPFAVKNVGYVTGFIGTLLTAGLYGHVVHTFLNVEYNLCKRLHKPHLTYVGVVESTFKAGPKRAHKLGQAMVSLVYFNYVFNGIMGNGSYLLVIGGNLKDIYDGYYGANINIKYCITVMMLPLVILCYIPKLSALIPYSTLTNLFNLLTFILIIAIPTKVGAARGTPKAFGNIFFFPQFFGMLLGALSATGLLLPVKNDMERPRSFGSPTGVMNTCLLISTSAYALFGLSGYLKYGDDTKGNIVSNLPEGQPISVSVYAMYTVAVCVSFTLSFYIIFDTIWSNYLDEKMQLRKSSRANVFLVKYGAKTLINALTYLIAVAIPNFELFSSLSGSLTILPEICIPSTLQIIVALSSSDKKRSLFVICKNLVIIAIALFLFVSAFVGSLNDIIDFYTDSP